jgi:hypothetical protein
MKYSFVVTGLLLLILANIFAIYQYSSYENFQGMPNKQPPNLVPQAAVSMSASGMSSPANVSNYPNSEIKEGFSGFFLSEAGGAKEKYTPIGAYDGVQLSTGNNTSVWRYTAPDEKLLGEEFVLGDDSLFMFKNNQCKPECCGASFTCGGGCVCTTPKQRQYLAGRGGNRTEPEDGV